VPDRLTVSAPASSANLGPGFDCLALALELRNDIVLTARDDDLLVVTIEGEGAEDAPRGADNLFLRAFAAAGGDPVGLDVDMLNAVPFARGLGSSAATIAAGLAAGSAWAETDDLDLLALATDLEGHPDNVAAALNGGLTLAWTGADGPRAIGFEPPPVGFVAVVADGALETTAARAALPAEVPYADAVHTAARAALLIAALGAGDPDLIMEALDDRLHEPYRAPLVPLLGTVRGRIAGDEAVLGATLSGAGPTVLVWCREGAEDQVAARLEGVPDGRPLVLAAAELGVIVS
jgi:homoserine kinase